MTDMKKIIITPLLLTLITFGLWLQACTSTAQPPPATNSPLPLSSVSEDPSLTLAVLDQLFTDKVFTAALKSKVQLTDDQIGALKKSSSGELANLRSANAENQAAAADAARARTLKFIRDLLGNEKTDQILALALERRSSLTETTATNGVELTQLKGPNAVPPDTRIVVNIPAFRMDVFRDGTLLKSYRIGIGYQEFPLPTGFRKAEMIIFNPTWTQPNESWASNPGQVVPAGAAGNPLGPIKVPIGGANLIHGGKVLAKIGTFASHGCVGLTNDQVKDFAKVLAEATNTELKEETIAAYLKKRTRTQVVKLSKIVPVELRYETIVIQDGQLHVYRDVYNKNTNTEDNLRAVFEANGIGFETLSEEQKSQALEAVNAMSLRPKKQPAPAVAANQTAVDKKALAAARKAEADRQRKLRSQKEVVIDLASLSSKGYPSPKDLNTGAGSKTIETAVLTPERPRRSPSPALQSSPRTSPTLAPQSSPRTNPIPGRQLSPRMSPTPAVESTPAVKPPH